MHVDPLAHQKSDTSPTNIKNSNNLMQRVARKQNSAGLSQMWRGGRSTLQKSFFFKHKNRNNNILR